MAEIQPNKPESRKPTTSIGLFVAFAALWVLAAAFYAGDIGKTRDDYTWAVNDPATGAVALADLWRLPLFWRPISLVLVRHLVSLTWEAPWLANLLTAIVHGVFALAVWRWFRSLGFVLGAGAGALLVLTLPAAYDVMHWPAAMPTALAGMCALAAAALAVRLRSRGWVRVAVGIAALTFVACCLNEQAAACMGALAILPLAVPTSHRIRHASIVGVSIALPCVLYVVIVRLSAPANHRGGASTFVPPSAWPERSVAALSGTWGELLGRPGRHLFLGGLEVGWLNLGALGMALAAIAVAAGLWWVWRTPGWREGEPSPSGPWVALVGVAWFALGLVPFVLVRTGPIEARHVYLPFVGLVLAGICVLTMLGRLLPRGVSGAGGRIVASVVLTAATVAAVSLVGVQTTQRVRYQYDMAEAEAIVDLLPDPQAGAVILIAHAPWREADTGYERYDRRFWSAWQMDHIATAVMRHAYGRDDLFAKHRFSISYGAAAREFSSDGWTIGLSDGPAWDGGQWPPRLIEWNRLLVVRLDEEGAAIPIDRLVLRREGGPDEVVRLPAMRARDFDRSPEHYVVRLR